MLDLLTQTDASEWLKKGNILIYPTEGVWGIGCDALNEKSVSRLYQLKKRPLDKSLIILCNNINDDFNSCFCRSPPKNLFDKQTKSYNSFAGPNNLFFN